MLLDEGLRCGTERVGSPVRKIGSSASLGRVVVGDDVAAKCALSLKISGELPGGGQCQRPADDRLIRRLSSRQIHWAEGQFARAAVGAAEAQGERFVAGRLNDETEAGASSIRNLEPLLARQQIPDGGGCKRLSVLSQFLAPNLVARNSIGHTGAAQLLLTAGDNPERLRSEASFASLCGVSPVPAPSGRTVRHRLNRGGDRAANSALHIIAIGRLRTDQRTKDYAARQLAEGHSKLDAIRALKRYLAREVFTLITQRRKEINATRIAA